MLGTRRPTHTASLLPSEMCYTTIILRLSAPVHLDCTPSTTLHSLTAEPPINPVRPILHGTSQLQPFYSTRAPCSASYLSSQTFSPLQSVHSNPPSLLWSLIPVTSFFVKYYGVRPRMMNCRCMLVITFVEPRFIYPLSIGATRLWASAETRFPGYYFGFTRSRKRQMRYLGSEWMCSRVRYDFSMSGSG
jgi:hypothetical protein